MLDFGAASMTSLLERVLDREIPETAGMVNPHPFREVENLLSHCCRYTVQRVG